MLDLHGDTNVDYRVVSTRTLLSASRVLRASWERGVDPKQAEELAAIRAQIREIVMLLLNERDIVAMLRSKVRAAILDKKPFVEILT